MIPSFPTCQKTLPDEPEQPHSTGMRWAEYSHMMVRTRRLFRPLFDLSP